MNTAAFAGALAHYIQYLEEIVVEEANWRIDGSLLEATGPGKPGIIDVNVIDSRVERLYSRFDFPFDIDSISEHAKQLNVPQRRKREPWVYKLLEVDMALGPGGYTLRFGRRTFGFFHLLKYDAIYRPMKYVYLPFGLTSCPACWSRDIAENASAHVEQCVRLLLVARNIPVKPKATLGYMIGRNAKQFKHDILESIDAINKLIYGRTKHEFKIELPREQLLSLTESLLVYFVCRKIGLELLRDSGVLADIVMEINKGRTQRGIFIGQEWFC